MGNNPQDIDQASATNDLKLGSTPTDQVNTIPTSKIQNGGVNYYQPVDSSAPEPAVPAVDSASTPSSVSQSQPTSTSQLHSSAPELDVDSQSKAQAVPTMGLNNSTVEPSAESAAESYVESTTSTAPDESTTVNSHPQIDNSTPVTAGKSQDVVEKMQAANKPAKVNPLSGLLRSKVGKIVLGLIAVIVIAVVGWSTYNEFFKQSTINSLPNANQQMNTVSDSRTNTGATTAVIKPYMAGNVCSGTSGRLYFYSLNEQKVYSKELPAGQTMFKADVPVGNYQVVFETRGTNLQIGATNVNHDLAVLNVDSDGLTGVEVCDDQMNRDSVPQESFAYGGEL